MSTYLSGQTLSERATSGFPLSIGTSLALESLFPPTQAVYDPDRKIPNHVNVGQYNSCWINVSTLFRNLHSAVTKEVFAAATVDQLGETLLEEMEVIDNLFKIDLKGGCVPIFYYSDYRDLLRSTRAGLSFRVPSTDGQRTYQTLLVQTLKFLDKHTDEVQHLHDTVRPKTHETALMLTHQPYDLTAFDRFQRLDLLESNTGILKPRALWHTKYNPMSGADFSRLPFLKKLLFIFGDRVLIKPGPLTMRNQILETAKARNWNAMTTNDKVRVDLSLDVRDPYFLSVFNSL